MNTTPNINLSTYTSDPNDKFNLLVTFNDNMTKIDTAVGAQNDAIDVIEETASTAVSTANTASATATEALQTAGSKTSINDNVASATTTYSSNKINTEITALNQKHFNNIENPDTNKYSDWSCKCADRGNIMQIYGSFRFNQAPSSSIITILTLPENMEFYIPTGEYNVTGYINKTGSMTFLKNDVIFRAYNNKFINMIFTDNFDYSQIDSTYLFHFSFTLIKN